MTGCVLTCWVRAQRIPFRTLFPDASAAAVDLLEAMLQFDPRKRITVEQARPCLHAVGSQCVNVLSCHCSLPNSGPAHVHHHGAGAAPPCTI